MTALDRLKAEKAALAKRQEDARAKERETGSYSQGKGKSMHQCVTIALLLCACGGLGSLPLAFVTAATSTGTAIEIRGLDDLSATADAQVKGGMGRMFAKGLALVGVAGLVSKQAWLALAGIGGGLGVAFIPSIIESGFTSAPAATGVLTHGPQLITAWWAPATVVLYPPLVLWWTLQDPVVLMSLVLVLVLQKSARQSRHAVAPLTRAT